MKNEYEEQAVAGIRQAASDLIAQRPGVKRSAWRHEVRAQCQQRKKAGLLVRGNLFLKIGHQRDVDFGGKVAGQSAQHQIKPVKKTGCGVQSVRQDAAYDHQRALHIEKHGNLLTFWMQTDGEARKDRAKTNCGAR